MPEKQFYTLTDVADLLHVKAHRILYLLGTGQVPEPQLWAGNRRLWTLPEIAVIAEKLKLQKAAEMEREEGGSHV